MNQKQKILKDLIGSTTTYVKTVRELQLSKEEKEIFMIASIEVRKKKPNYKKIDQAYDILIYKSYKGNIEDFANQNTTDTKPDNAIVNMLKKEIGTDMLLLEFSNKYNLPPYERGILSSISEKLKWKTYDVHEIQTAYKIVKKYTLEPKNLDEKKMSSPNIENNQKTFIQGKKESDEITNKFGFGKIENSSSSFFSEAFKKHDSDEVEKLLSVGTAATTPMIDTNMGRMPSPWIFIRIFFVTIGAYLLFLIAWSIYHNIILIPGLLILGSFAVPFSVLILFFELNTPKNISIFKIIQFVIVGGVLSQFISLILYDVTSIYNAGIIEESAKLAAVLILVNYNKKNQYKYILNALLLGAAVGTGFSAFESAGYALKMGIISSAIMTDNIQLRGLLSPFGHIIWTAITASAYWMARPYCKSAWTTLISYRFLKIYFLPVLLHFIWNLPFEGPFMIKYVILGFIGWAVIIRIVKIGLKEIGSLSSSIIPS